MGAQLAETLFDARQAPRSGQADAGRLRRHRGELPADRADGISTGGGQLWRSCASSPRRPRSSDRAVTAAQQSLDISTIQYRGGLANYLQVITAQTSMLQNQRAAVDILTRRLVASVSLIQALGGGWDASQLPSAQEVRR